MLQAYEGIHIIYFIHHILNAKVKISAWSDKLFQQPFQRT